MTSCRVHFRSSNRNSAGNSARSTHWILANRSLSPDTNCGPEEMKAQTLGECRPGRGSAPDPKRDREWDNGTGCPEDRALACRRPQAGGKGTRARRAHRNSAVENWCGSRSRWRSRARSNSGECVGMRSSSGWRVMVCVSGEENSASSAEESAP